MSTNPPSFRYPFALKGVSDDVRQAHVMAYQGILDLQQANASLKTQIEALKIASSSSSSSSSTTTVTGVTSFNGSTGAVSFFPALATRDDQTGQTAYTIQQGDSGALLILNDASPVAVSLNPAIVTPFFMFAMNLGAGTVTFAPTSPALINYYGNIGAASMPLLPGTMALIQYDGTNWNAATIQVPATFSAGAHQWIKTYDAATGLYTATRPDYSDLTGTPQLANTKTPVSHEWLASYDAVTGNFTQSQPDFTDISGALATSQLPAAGISSTITTAALTAGGTQGSMTFVNGLLTAQVQAT